QQWAAAVHQLPAKREMPVIEPATHADAIAARVKTDQWHEHHVELARGARRRAKGFKDAERTLAGPRSKIEEAHAVMAHAGDPWQCHLATAAACQREQGCGIDLFGG